MAGIIAHIALSDKMFSLSGGRIKSAPLFFCGNIAPDSIHSRENFERAMKKHTHLRDGIVDKDFQKPENIRLFHHRLSEFVKKYCHKDDGLDELYLGYVSHLLADELFIYTVREDFVKKAEKIGVSQSDKEFFRLISKDTDSIDARISQEYPFEKNPSETLFAASGYEIRDYLTKDELEKSKGWIVYNFFETKRPFETPLYMTYESVMEYIEKAAEEILNRLSEMKLI